MDMSVLHFLEKEVAKLVIQKKTQTNMFCSLPSGMFFPSSIKIKLQLFKMIPPFPLRPYLDLHTASHPFLLPCATSVPFALPALSQWCVAS